jgi:hypothetical protein
MMTRAMCDLAMPGMETGARREGVPCSDQQARIADIERRVERIRTRRDEPRGSEGDPDVRGERNRVAASGARSIFEGTRLMPGGRTGRVARSAFAGENGRRDRAFFRTEHDSRRGRLGTTRSACRLAAANGTGSLQATFPGGFARRRCSRARTHRQGPHDRQQGDPGKPKVLTNTAHVDAQLKLPGLPTAPRIIARAAPGTSSTLARCFTD